jgi:hypothetical protein
MNEKLSTIDDINKYVESLDTGDILFFSTGLFHSIVSFVIMTGCNSKWTHSSMVVRSKGKVYLWESVNNHSEKSPFMDIRTNKAATGNGVRLINLKEYLISGQHCLKKTGHDSCIIGTLKLNPKLKNNNLLKSQIEDYVLNESSKTTLTYPKSALPLIKTWYDGCLSCFVPFGCLTTYEVELINLETNYNAPETHSHYKHTENTNEEIICSQLIIMTLEKTNYFRCQIPCNDWTVEDLTLGRNINMWFIDNQIGYQEKTKTRILICKN